MKTMDFAYLIGLVMMRLDYQRLRRNWGEGYEETLASDIHKDVDKALDLALEAIELPHLPGIVLKSGR